MRGIRRAFYKETFSEVFQGSIHIIFWVNLEILNFLYLGFAISFGSEILKSKGP